MKIKKISCKNFRQFKDELSLSFDTNDGKINIIYGFNGSGKTTLHQLFQWVFYGKVNFSNDITGALYNVAYADGIKINNEFCVEGEVEYWDERFRCDFRLSRKKYFVKELLNIRPSKEIVKMMYKQPNKDWVETKKSYVEFLNQQLPERLSHYFFFDGERMVKNFIPGKHSTSLEEETLKKTIYSIFKLDTYEIAINDIGSDKEINSVIGKIINSIPTNLPSSDRLKLEFDRACKNYEDLEKKIKLGNESIADYENKIKKLSEDIGNTKTLSQLEEIRKSIQHSRNIALNTLNSARIAVANQMISIYPTLLLSNRMLEAKDELNMQISQSELPVGLNKELINYLLKQNTCICGQPLDEKDKKQLKEWLQLLPPNSPKIIYDSFVRKAREEISNASNNLDKINVLILNYINANQAINDIDEKIDNQDFNILKKAADDIKPLVEQRNKLENELRLLRNQVEILKRSLPGLEQEKKVAQNRLRSFNEKAGNYQFLRDKADILKQVKELITEEFNSLINKYTSSLSRNIDLLLSNMFNGERRAVLDSSFTLHVYDDYNNESMSEGQFAVVTFAYIGGILSSLRENNINKLFPLVLDGPFSKLDPEHVKNVVKNLPSFANQVIIFSKDNLDAVLDPSIVGAVYSIESNDQRNIASVRGIK